MYCTLSGNEMNSRICGTLRMASGGRGEKEKEFQKSKFIPYKNKNVKKKCSQY